MMGGFMEYCAFRDSLMETIAQHAISNDISLSDACADYGEDIERLNDEEYRSLCMIYENLGGEIDE